MNLRAELPRVGWRIIDSGYTYAATLNVNLHIAIFQGSSLRRLLGNGARFNFEVLYR